MTISLAFLYRQK